MASNWASSLNLLLAILFGQAYGGQPLIAQQDWLLPLYPDYTTTFTIGQTYHISWDSNLKNWFSSWCKVCGDPSHVDLWVQTGNNEDSQYKIASGVNVNTTTSWPWTVNIAPKNATMDKVWVLRFVAFDATPNNISGDSISSSLFQIKAPASLLSSSSTSSTTTTSATMRGTKTPLTTSSPSTTSTSHSGGLTSGAQAGIGVGVGVAAVLFLASCYYFYVTRRNRRQQKGWPQQSMDLTDGAPREQTWAYKVAPGNMEASQNAGWGGFSRGSEMPSDVRPLELPGHEHEHTSELGVERRK